MHIKTKIVHTIESNSYKTVWGRLHSTRDKKFDTTDPIHFYQLNKILIVSEDINYY